jgi:hypothetical protein
MFIPARYRDCAVSVERRNATIDAIKSGRVVQGHNKLRICIRSAELALA